MLPLWNREPEALSGQLRSAVLDYQRVFGRDPNGIWLPECAYTPGVEKAVQEAGLHYFFSETETINQADSHADFLWHAPAYIRGSDVAVFARDYETGRIVWSADEGYPGYSAMVLASGKLIASNPAAVKAFVDGTAAGVVFRRRAATVRRIKLISAKEIVGGT